MTRPVIRRTGTTPTVKLALMVTLAFGTPVRVICSSGKDAVGVEFRAGK
ncbi:MAG: hypothetical protein Q8Q12_05370 [bacterium]|nr:hypothetical protein [bacterium]